MGLCCRAGTEALLSHPPPAMLRCQLPPEGRINSIRGKKINKIYQMAPFKTKRGGCDLAIDIQSMINKQQLLKHHKNRL